MLLWEIAQQVFQSVVVSTLHLEKRGATAPATPPAPPPLHVTHLISECKLAQKKCKRRHDNAARIVHWKLCGLYELERAEKWYAYQPNGVIESDEVKILWDFNIQCDSLIECRRPDIVVVLKTKKECKIMDVAVPGDSRAGEKELEKMENLASLTYLCSVNSIRVKRSRNSNGLRETIYVLQTYIT